MKFFLFIFLLTFLSFHSCQTNEKKIERISLQPVIINDSLVTMLPGGNVICSDYFVWQDGFATDTFMHIVELSTGKEIGKMGKIGRGAEEFLSPCLIGSIHNDVIVMDDNLPQLAQYSIDSLLAHKNPYCSRPSLPLKQPLFVSSMDSSAFLCLKSSGLQPIQIIRNNEIISRFGKFPLTDSISNPSDVFQGSVIYNKQKDLILYSTNRFPYAALYQRNSNQSFDLKKETNYPFYYTIENNKMKLSQDNQDGFRCPVFTKDYIIFKKQDEQNPLPKQRRTPGIRDVSNVPHTVYVFDYNLNLIKIADLNMPVLDIKSTVENNTLYIVGIKDSYCIAECDIP